MRELWTYTALCFGSVFAIVDPFAAIPIFLALTGDRPSNARTVALRASTTSAVVLLVFAAAGSFILRFFSITLPAFKIAGGVLLFAVGLEMLRATASRTRSTEEEQTEAHAKEDVAVVPLGIPLLAGPGAIATVVVLASKAGDLEHRAVVFVCITVVALITFLVLRSASFVSRALGQTGINLIGRVMGLILAATAVQFVIDGAREAFPRVLG
ncbi:MAG TPA: MarC family protein [Polyangiaceae bacterium]|nr:MarC family protein [Polyangiaceae bacterium]